MNRTSYITAAAILAALLVATPGQVIGQSTEEYLKKSNPDELHVLFLLGSKCPDTRGSYQRIIDGELVRARIKESTIPGELYLFVEIDCLPIEQGGNRTGFVYIVEPTFKVNQRGPKTIPTYHRVLGYVIGGPNFEDETAQEIRRTLREEVSNILTDYLKANQAP